MKVLLFNISLRPKSPLKLFPIGLSYVASAIDRAGFDLEIIDIDANRYSSGALEEHIAGKSFDVAAMGCIVTGYKYVKELAATVRRLNEQATIIVGNSVGSSIPRILLDNTEADIVVMGEGDVTIVDLLDHLADRRPIEGVSGICFKAAGKVVSTPARPVIQNIDEIPLINRDLFDVETYITSGRQMVNEPLPMAREKLRPLQINTARGCLYKCTFCYHVFQGEKYRHRSARSIVAELAEIKNRYDVNYVQFYDELTFFSVSQATDIVEAILEADLDILWEADVRGNMFKDDLGLALARKMKQAGCVGLGYSLESADREILNMMDKRMTPEQFLTQKGILDQADISSWTSLVFGYPTETKESIMLTLDCCREAGIYPSAGYLLPQPGTPMYDYIVSEGYVSDEEEYALGLGDRQDLYLNLTSMSDTEFQQTLNEGLEKLSDDLGIGLTKEKLIKTSYYRAKKKEPSERASGS